MTNLFLLTRGALCCESKQRALLLPLLSSTLLHSMPAHKVSRVCVCVCVWQAPASAHDSSLVASLWRSMHA